MPSDVYKWTQSGDDADPRIIVKAAENEREAVLLEPLEGCSNGSAVKGLGGKAGSRSCRLMTASSSFASDWLFTTWKAAD